MNAKTTDAFKILIEKAETNFILGNYSSTLNQLMTIISLLEQEVKKLEHEILTRQQQVSKIE